MPPSKKPYSATPYTISQIAKHFVLEGLEVAF